MLSFPDPPLSDGEITLRAKTAADADTLVAICADPEIPRWTRVPTPYRREHALEWIAGSELELAAERSIDWLAEDAEGRVLASVGLMDIDRAKGYGEIGYWVAAGARGRGVATRAVRLVCEWAQHELGLRALEIVVHEHNHPSRAVALRAGFVQTGELRRAPKDDVPDGAYLVFSAP